MTQDLGTPLTGLYVEVGDAFEGTRWLGRSPGLTDSELVCLAVVQVLLGFDCEARWMRFAHVQLRAVFPYLPERSGCNKRLKAALSLVERVIQAPASDTAFWFDNVWIIDSTPVECGRSHPTLKRSSLAGWAGYGYCRFHSRWYWGLRLFLVCAPGRDADHLGTGQPRNRRTRRGDRLDRVTQRIPAITAAIWHNHHTSAPVSRPLIALDHRPHRNHPSRSLTGVSR